MESRTAGRGRKGAVVLLALLAVAALLLWLALREGAVESPTEAHAPNAAASGGGVSDDVAALRPRTRAAPRSADTATSETTAETTPSPLSSGPALVNGWPAADVIVRRSDGTLVPRALVYVLRAGEPSPANVHLIPRSPTGADGRARLPVATAGRYDVGALVAGEPFSGLTLDVTFPTTSPVEVVLPALVPLQVRKEGDLPASGWVTFSRTDAESISAFSGRSQSGYAGGDVKRIGSHVLVPPGLPMRVRARGGVVATPLEVVAPGPVTLRPDSRREVEVEFVFAADAELAARWFQFTFRFEATPGDPESWDAGVVRLPPAPRETTRRVKLLCPPAPTTVRWRCSSDPGRAGGEAVLDAAAVPAGGVHRIQVPVRREDFRLFGFRVVGPPGTDVRDLRVLTSLGRLFEYGEVVPGREYWFASPVEEAHGDRALAEPVAAVARADDHWLVSGPTNVAPDRVVDLPLVVGELVRIRSRLPPEVGGAWPLEVCRAQPSFLADVLVDEPALRLVPAALLREESAILGPFPPGNVELAFRFGGREIGRRTVFVVAGATIDVDAPEILPPMR